MQTTSEAIFGEMEQGVGLFWGCGGFSTLWVTMAL